MNYSVLGTSCSSRTIAFTSNKKFFPVCAPIYNKKYNYVLKCPGSSDTNTNHQTVDLATIRSHRIRSRQEEEFGHIHDPHTKCPTC